MRLIDADALKEYFFMRRGASFIPIKVLNSFDVNDTDELYDKFVNDGIANVYEIAKIIGVDEVNDETD